MSSIFNGLYSIWNQLIYAVSSMGFSDFVDILLLGFIIYKAIGFLRESRAGQLVKGLVILLVMYLIAGWWELTAMQWLLSGVFNSIIIAIAVIFQPELRRILEKVGRTNFAHNQLFDDAGTTMTKSIESIIKAAAAMSDKKIGALIVFERTTQLGEIINTGTIIDAEASPSMINNIFFPNTPLHDGAMIVRNGRLYAAGCILPLTQREDLSLQLGTRHRAAIGMTENSDAVVLIVSEETGIISIAVNGAITRNYSPVSAEAELKRLLVETKTDENKGTVSTVIKKIIPKKKGNVKEVKK